MSARTCSAGFWNPITRINSPNPFNPRVAVCPGITEVVIVAIMINIEKNGQLFLKTCFGMLMPSSV